MQVCRALKNICMKSLSFISKSLANKKKKSHLLLYHCQFYVAEAKQNNFQSSTADRTWSSLWENALSRCVLEGRSCQEDQPLRSESAGRKFICLKLEGIFIHYYINVLFMHYNCTLLFKCTSLVGQWLGQSECHAIKTNK